MTEQVAEQDTEEAVPQASKREADERAAARLWLVCLVLAALIAGAWVAPRPVLDKVTALTSHSSRTE